MHIHLSVWRIVIKFVFVMCTCMDDVVLCMQYAYFKMNASWNWEVNKLVSQKIRVTWWNGINDAACIQCTMCTQNLLLLLLIRCSCVAATLAIAIHRITKQHAIFALSIHIICYHRYMVYRRSSNQFEWIFDSIDIHNTCNQGLFSMRYKWKK